MSYHFKSGDLALTLISLSILPVGSVVELYKAINPGDNLGSARNPIPAVRRGWWCAHSEIGDRLPFAETSLMPLRGDFATEQQKAKEAV
ncbi:hypothetical protein [Pseudomonas protegens]|uniref:hypothetical protein n=1 Tax=Pseudomonas protegens TaxID=380021 RepID=UPI000C998B77|nr:hypothetical protein [Pseudomonas protegens]PNG31528.1 hypothetical protein A1348_16405 [Pseudomonas protegens]